MSKDQKTLKEMPSEASELLPWFLNGTLPPEEEVAVAKQLLVSPRMQDDLAELQTISEVVRETQPSDWQPSAGHLGSIMARIGADAPPETDQATARPLIGLADSFRAMGRGMRWVFAAQLAMILILAGTLMVKWVQPPAEGTYQTLTSTTGLTVQERSIKVAFSPDATAEQMQTLLASIDATIIDGPSALGLFTIAIPDDMMVETARDALRGSPIVLLVQIQQISKRY